MALPTVQHKEYPVTSDTYLNLYSGIDNVQLEKFVHYTEMTDDQKATFESFVTAVEENRDNKWDAIQPDQLTCLRFLQADKYDKDVAMARLVQNQAWLKEANIPALLTTPPVKLETYRKLRARAYMGQSNAGMPIFVERLGDFMNGIPSSEGKTLTSQDYTDCFLYDLGELLGHIRDSYARTCDDDSIATTWRATWIMDCLNVRFFRATKATGTLKLLDGCTEPNFPELAGPVTIMNVPSIVSGVWRVCRAFLDATVAAKIQIHSGIPKDELLERMPESVLFEEFGGSNAAQLPKAEYS